MDNLLLREYLPLEQGLRLDQAIHIVIGVRLREYLPLEQGLRPIHSRVILCYKSLREYLPLEQGLRRFILINMLVCSNSESIFH